MVMRSSMLYLGAQMTAPHSSILLPTKLCSVSIETFLSVTSTIKRVHNGSISISRKKLQYKENF
jgi:hypothetical protein